MLTYLHVCMITYVARVPTVGLRDLTIILSYVSTESDGITKEKTSSESDSGGKRKVFFKCLRVNHSRRISNTSDGEKDKLLLQYNRLA